MFSQLVAVLLFWYGIVLHFVMAVPTPTTIPRSRFRSIGPMLTITIPSRLAYWSSSADSGYDVSSKTSSQGESIIDNSMGNRRNDEHIDSVEPQQRSINKRMKKAIMNMQNVACTTLDSMLPSCVYTITTRQPPLPYWCPALKACSTRMGYSHLADRNQRNVILHDGSVGPCSNLSSEVLSKSSPSSSSNGFIDGIAKFECNWMGGTDVLQIAIRPCYEWITTRSRRDQPTTQQERPILKTSLLFHARRDNSSYAWCRFMSSSSLPSSHPISDQDDSDIGSRSEVEECRNQHSCGSSPYLETTVRASTTIAIPLASLSSIRVTPTVRFIQMFHHLPKQPPNITKKQKKGSILSYPQYTNQFDHRLCDASCQFEATSGGQGRTTATLTVSPLASTEFMNLAMEYRLSGLNVLPFLFRRLRPVGAIHSQHQPQHWIRQIWEWNRPAHRPKSISSNQSSSLVGEKSPLDRGTIIASQYQWLTVWPSGQSFRTIFDPPRSEYYDENRNQIRSNGAVTFTWIDPINQNMHDTLMTHDILRGSGDSVGGTWITDVRIPFLESPNRSIRQHIPRDQRNHSLLVRNLSAAEVRVRRQFHF
jgi:hypothetical protein